MVIAGSIQGAAGIAANFSLVLIMQLQKNGKYRLFGGSFYKFDISHIKDANKDGVLDIMDIDYTTNKTRYIPIQ